MTIIANPGHGPADSSVTITGTGFGATQGNSTVTVGGVAAVVATWNDGAIVTAVPHGATKGPGKVVVTVNGKASEAAFTVDA